MLPVSLTWRCVATASLGQAACKHLDKHFSSCHSWYHSVLLLAGEQKTTNIAFTRITNNEKKSSHNKRLVIIVNCVRHCFVSFCQDFTIKFVFFLAVRLNNNYGTSVPLLTDDLGDKIFTRKWECRKIKWGLFLFSDFQNKPLQRKCNVICRPQV